MISSDEDLDEMEGSVKANGFHVSRFRGRYEYDVASWHEQCRWWAIEARIMDRREKEKEKEEVRLMRMEDRDYLRKV